MNVREALKQLSTESLVYGLGQVSGRAVQLLLVPILTRALAQQVYGVADLVMAYSQTVVLVLVFGTDAALARFFYDEPDRAARIRMVSTSLLFRVAASITAAALLGLLAVPLAPQLLGSAVYRKYLLVGALTLPWTLLALFSNDVLRVTFQPWKFIALNLTQTLIVGGLTLYFVLGRGLGVVGVLYGKLGGDAATAVLGLILNRHAIRARFDPAILRRMLGYGVPLVPVAFAYGAISSMDRFFLQRTRSLEEVAVYAVAAKFFAVVSMAVSALQLAFGPFAFSRAKSPEAPRLFARVFMLYTALASLGALAAGAFAPEILRLVAPPAYAAAARPAVWLAFAAVAPGAYYVATLGLQLALRTTLLGWTAAGAALIAAAANLILTPRLGPTGAALATFAGYASSAALTYAVAQRVHRLPYRGGRAALLFVVALGLALAVQSLAPPGAVGIAAKAGVVVGFAALAAALEVWRDRGAVAAIPS